ncbi:hypothetical protein EC973_008487 [Apophysomyces ossiformis]|uniref:EF-hand domain-containing protein n=1 Tax=Apophysomyces ossiformis TaxID=679940 RepID=A0A8H7BSS7_9FUNG|nr:hypothetical protein EC973_008487 [Apophysomyces ossiformis]
MSSKRASLGLHFLSSKKKLELQDMFNSFDKNHDGKISNKELQEMLQSSGMNASAVPAMLSSVQTDTDGNLSFEEFAKLMRPTLSDPIRPTAKEQELREAFDAFDRDGDGVINAIELRSMMQKLGDRITEEEAEQMIKDVDENNDGVVNFDEFAKMMGVRPRSHPISANESSNSSKTCPHHHHRFSIRQFFCTQKHSTP